MLIIVAGSRWAGNAGRAAGWRAHMRCRACTASCYQMAVTAIVAGERYSLVCFCWACSVHVLAPICQTAFVAPRPHERELSGHERSTCAAVHALPAATRWQSQLSSLASATYLFASAGRVLCIGW